jgi:bacterioferritin-associated ferredoxin
MHILQVLKLCQQIPNRHVETISRVQYQTSIQLHALTPLHCTKCAEVLAQHVASGNNFRARAHDLLELADTAAALCLFL